MADSAGPITITVRQRVRATAAACWGEIGNFEDMSWSGPEEWKVATAEDGTKTRSLAEHGLKEQLVSTGDKTLTYRMLEGPFEDFTCILAAKQCEDDDSLAEMSYIATAKSLNGIPEAAVSEGVETAFKKVANKIGEAA